MFYLKLGIKLVVVCLILFGIIGVLLIIDLVGGWIGFFVRF